MKYLQLKLVNVGMGTALFGASPLYAVERTFLPVAEVLPGTKVLPGANDCQSYFKSTYYNTLPNHCSYYLSGYLDGLLNSNANGVAVKTTSSSEFFKRALRTRLGQARLESSVNKEEFCVPLAVDKVDLYWSIKEKLTNKKNDAIQSIDQVVINTLKENYPC